MRCCFVDTIVEFRGIRRMSHQRVHLPASRFSPPGPDGCPFPGFTNTIRTLRLPAARLAALRFLRLAIPAGTSRPSLPPAQDVKTGGPGGFGCGTPTAAHFGGDDRISQVPGEPPLSVCHVLGLRQDGRFQTFRNHHTAPDSYTTKAPTGQLSKLYSMASRLAVYASPKGSPLRSARLASECGSGFPGRA